MRYLLYAFSCSFERLLQMYCIENTVELIVGPVTLDNLSNALPVELYKPTIINISK